jgi:putative phosphotransacetylase
MKVEIEYSNRHIHITKEVLERLFGPGYNLSSEKKLSQCDDFAAQETVTLIGPKGKIENVRIIGPVREKTQIEILKSDAFILGIEAPFKLSGDLNDTPGIKMTSPLNEVDLEEGVIIAKRHLHITPEEAEKNKLKDGQKVQLEIKGERALILKEIIVRIKECFQTRVHIDIEEANAAGIKQNDKGKII